MNHSNPQFFSGNLLFPSFPCVNFVHFVVNLFLTHNSVSCFFEPWRLCGEETRVHFEALVSLVVNFLIPLQGLGVTHYSSLISHNS